MRIRRKVGWTIVVLGLSVVLSAYLHWAIAGLPVLPPIHNAPSPGKVFGFPIWVCITHYINFFFIILLIRSGLQILMDHPRLYWNVHCTPGTEWIRFTSVRVPQDPYYTSKMDARYLSPWIGLPGGRHTLGLARHWHFISVLFWVTNGFVFYILLFSTGHWTRLVPTTWSIFPEAWAYLVHYVTFHFPPEPNGYYQFNALQQLAYFGVVFLLAPLSILTGPSMSPALTNRFSWYRKVPGNRQIGRSIHFLALCGYVVFIAVHVLMVCISGFVRNMNHIVLGTDEISMLGVYLGIAGLIGLILLNGGANILTKFKPRLIQRAGDQLVNPVLQWALANRPTRAEFLPKDISPYFWANGKLPTKHEWKAAIAEECKNYRLKVFGKVEHPVELSLKDLRALGKQSQITLHHCIQGWSGIAQWGGLPMRDLIKLVKPKAEVKAVIFYSYGEGSEGGDYYDSHSLENMLHPQALLAYEMNFKLLNDIHGSPLRLRVENELGFKMVKWIQAIEFVEDYRKVREGYGGYASDHEFFDSMANI